MKKAFFMKMILSVFCLSFSFQAQAITKSYRVGDYQIQVPDSWEFVADSQGFRIIKMLGDKDVMSLQTHWNFYSKDHHIYDAIQSFEKKKHLDKFQNKLKEGYQDRLEKIKIENIEKQSINDRTYIIVKWSGVPKKEFCIAGMIGKTFYFNSYFFSEKISKVVMPLYRNYSIHCYATKDTRRINKQFKDIMKSFGSY